MFVRLGAGAHTTAYHSPEWHLEAPHPEVIQSAVHAPGNWSPLTPSTPLWDLCVFALVDSCPSPTLLRFTLMFNPILTVSFFSPRKPLGQSWISKGLFTWQDYPSFQSHWGRFFSHKKHIQWIFCSLALFLSVSFTLSLTPFCLCPFGPLLNTLIHPIEEFICCSS